MLAVMAGLLVVAASALAIRMARQVEDRTAQQQQTQVRMYRIQAALHAFAASHGRLPCPADGMDVNDRGYAAPNAASDICASPDGTVPWGSLGLTKDDAFDAWGRKISYRVYAGPTGMTRTRGADMTDCDTVEPAPVAPTPLSYDCTPAHNVRPGPGMDTYLDLDPNTRPGLTVRVGGIDQKQMAWVLVSHGASGMGAWLPGGARMALPASADEQANTQPPPAVYVQREEATVDLDPATDAAHFDDLLRFETIAQLIQAGARVANVAEPLLRYRVSAGAFHRRGGVTLLRSEIEVQRRFLAMGFTTPVQAGRNVVLRGAYRLTPEPVRRTAYRAYHRLRSHSRDPQR